MANNQLLQSSPVQAGVKSMFGQGATMGSSASALSGIGGMASILAMGAFGMPSGKAHIDALKKQREASIMKPLMENLQAKTPAGMSYGDWIESRRAPETPWDREQRSIFNSSGGDKDYEVDAAFQMYNNNPNKDAQNAAWLKQSDGRGGLNSDWYNPDMTRTDYSGKYADPLSVQRAQLSPQEQARQALLVGNSDYKVAAGGNSQQTPFNYPTNPAVQQAPQPFQSPFAWGGQEGQQPPAGAPIEGRKTMGMFGNAARNQPRQLRTR